MVTSGYEKCYEKSNRGGVRWGGDQGTFIRAIKGGFLKDITLRPESEKGWTMRTFQKKQRQNP